MQLKLADVKSSIKNLDFVLLLIAGAVSVIGIIMVASATKSLDSNRYVIVQGAAFLIGVVMIYSIIKLDYEFIASLWGAVFAFNIVALVTVLILGRGAEETGTQGWIIFGPVGLQPAEFVKLGFIITLSKHISKIKEKDDLNNLKNVLLLLLHLAVPVFLILMQPDAGTAMVFIFIFIMMIYMAGVDWKYLLGGALIAAAAIPLIYYFVLNGVQQNRILNFLYPERDPLNTGYQVLQSKIAIGSGRIFGKGLFQGTQTQLGFLPEKHNDFIFAVIGEELGIIGCIIVAVLLFCLAARIFHISRSAKNDLGKLICVGVGSMYLFHTVENICMTLGLLPVTGICLPFVSYGGSAMLTCVAGLGLVLSVRMRRKMINF